MNRSLDDCLGRLNCHRSKHWRSDLFDYQLLKAVYMGLL